MTYQLIRQSDEKEFTRIVNVFLKDGWNLKGDTILRTENTPTAQNVTIFYQAMVK